MYTIDDLTVYIFNWKRVSENTRILYDKIHSIVQDVVIINCDENYAFGPNIDIIHLNDSCFFGKQFDVSIKHVEDGKIFCTVVGDIIADNNFENIFVKALESFNSHNVGIFAPNDIRTSWTQTIRHIKDMLYEPVNTDLGFIFINPQIVRELRNIDFTVSKYGWGIDLTMIKYARDNGFLVLRDYSIETDQLTHECEYDTHEASEGMHALRRTFDVLAPTSLSYLRVYAPTYKKCRIGNVFDGGYIICDIPNVSYDMFISGGISTDVSFENHMLFRYPDLICHAFDGTIDSLPQLAHPRIQFHKKNLGLLNTDTHDNLDEYFKNSDNIFMKLDIEGGENELFDAIPERYLLKVSQLVIEFHSANQITIPSRLARTHWLVHLHPNNCCGVGPNGVPNVFECTYVRKDYMKNLQFNSDAIPNPELDMPNLSYEPEIVLHGYPFIEVP